VVDPIPQPTRFVPVSSEHLKLIVNREERRAKAVIVALTGGEHLMDELRVVVANMQFGGISREDLSLDRWDKIIERISTWNPHVLLCQEMTALLPFRFRKHLWRTANALDLMPVAGPATPQSVSGNHPAVFVSPVFTILDDGPPRSPWSGLEPCWCDLTLSLPGLVERLHVYSVHMPPRSGTLQRIYAEWLSSLIADEGLPAIVAGDWNSYSRQGPHPDLEQQPPHLVPARMHLDRDGNRSVNTTVHDLLYHVAHLRDVALLAPAGRRIPPAIVPTGITGGRGDRAYVTKDLADMVTRFEQAGTGGSDHDAFMFALRAD
jgi:hypothetical protein